MSINYFRKSVEQFVRVSKNVLVAIFVCECGIASAHSSNVQVNKNQYQVPSKIESKNNNGQDQNKKENKNKFSIVINAEGALGLHFGKGQPIHMHTFLLDSHRLDHHFQKFNTKHSHKSEAELFEEHCVNSVEKAFRECHNQPFMLEDLNHNSLFIDLETGKEKKFESTTSGSYKLGLICANFEFLKMEKADVGLEVGVGFGSGMITEKSQYASVNRRIKNPMILVGPVFKYKISQKMRGEFSIFASLYSTEISVEGNRDNLTKDNLKQIGETNIKIKQEAIDKYLKDNQSNFEDVQAINKKEFSQKDMAQELDTIFDNLDSSNKEHNTFSTAMAPGIGVGFAFSWEFAKNFEFRLSTKYIFAHNAKTSSGEKMSEAKYLVASHRPMSQGHALPDVIQIRRNGMLLASIGISYRLI